MRVQYVGCQVGPICKWLGSIRNDTVHNLTDYVDDGKFDEWIKSFENYDKELTYQELASLIGIQVPDNTQEELCPDSDEDINQWGETIETNSVC